MSTPASLTATPASLTAFIPDTDETYQLNKKVLLACAEAGVDLPVQVAEYFGSKSPYRYLLDEKLEFPLKKGVHYEEYGEDMEEGFEIEISKLPKEVTKIRFVNSY